MDVAKRSGIAIYTITLRTETQRLLAREGSTPVTGAFAMRALAQETGARAFFPAMANELSGIYGMIADELASQYAVGYISTNTRHDGTYRRVEVRVTQPNLRTRTRSGYIAGGAHPLARVH